MKNATKKVLAILMTLLMVTAIFPITASAKNCYKILVELNEPYFGENLAEILPELEFELGVSVLNDGLWFMVYYDASSIDEVNNAIEKLKKNPLVKDAIYDKPHSQNTSGTARFMLYMTPACLKNPDYLEIVDLWKFFPEIKFSNAATYGGELYEVACDVETMEEVYLIYDKFAESPFVFEIWYYRSPGNYATIGYLDIVMKDKYTEEEIKGLFPELGISKVSNTYGNGCRVYFSERTLRATYEAGRVLEESPYVLSVSYGSGTGDPLDWPEEIDEAYYRAPEKPEVTVETALAALRITVGLSETKNGVYDYRLADALWQFDVDGDKVITVSDALSLLRIAAGIKA